MKNKLLYPLAALLSASLLFTGCGTEKETAENGLIPITLQTDWYAQAEHGGFYQAVVEGYYEEVGLDVTIQQGGPNAMGTQKVVSQSVEFGIGRADDIVVHAANKLPLVIVSALMQHDPQALLVHEESGINSFKDLDGRTVMATPGAAMIRFLEKRFDISINLVPLDFGMSRFLADVNFVQQCFITNEPYYIKKEGANAKTLLIADSGYDPYRVIFTSRGYATKNPEIVKAFVAASNKGWKSYMAGPREKANALITQLHPKMTEEFLNYSVKAMIENHLIEGNEAEDQTGLIQPKRMQGLIDNLLEVGVIDTSVDAHDLAPTKYFPADLQAMVTK
ncbi:MAG TPA: myristoyl transferase [Opitutae bacterium]|nr:myristoyl transferase [Opitutae bacterium]